MKRKKNAIFAKKSFVIIKMKKKKKINYTKKSEISVITLKKLEDQLLVFPI